MSPNRSLLPTQALGKKQVNSRKIEEKIAKWSRCVGPCKGAMQQEMQTPGIPAHGVRNLCMGRS